MEKTRNLVIDLFKKFCFAISRLVNGGEVDNVELTGELANKPKALQEYINFVTSVEEPVRDQTIAENRTPTRIPTPGASATKYTPARGAAAPEQPPTKKNKNNYEREM